MITKATVVGLKHGISKDNKEFTTLCLDISHTIPEKDRVGTICGKTAVWGNALHSIVGKDVICSVDDRGRIQDVNVESI